MQDFLFSSVLVGRTQKYFLPKYGREISVAEAMEILCALAGGYEAMSGAASARLKAAQPPDLINTHNCNL